MTSLQPIRVERNPCNIQRKRTLVRSSEIETTRMSVEWTVVRVEYRFRSPRLRDPRARVETRPRNSTTEKKKKRKKREYCTRYAFPAPLEKRKPKREFHLHFRSSNSSNSRITMGYHLARSKRLSRLSFSHFSIVLAMFVISSRQRGSI